jgi:hypothetical protein
MDSAPIQVIFSTNLMNGGSYSAKVEKYKEIEQNSACQSFLAVARVRTVI